ncbi:hypothetical protein GPALN_015052 [Globodera pallida]|nr:hypothetical protein GPALN_015052 [Globodera pallida]
MLPFVVYKTAIFPSRVIGVWEHCSQRRKDCKGWGPPEQIGFRSPGSPTVTAGEPWHLGVVELCSSLQRRERGG